MIQKTLPVGALQCNCQVLVCPETLATVIVDPGDEANRILETIRKIEESVGGKLQVKALLHTHAHFDHMGATRGVKEALLKDGIEAPSIFLHKGDEMMYQMLKRQGEMFGFECEDPLPIDQFIEDEQELKFGNLKLQVLHTPGHSPGGVCFRLHQDTGNQIPEMVFTGDTLFQGSVGRSDLWGGDGSLLIKSIKSRLLTLDGDTVAWPGHGSKTTIGVEKTSNPYL